MKKFKISAGYHNHNTIASKWLFFARFITSWCFYGKLSIGRDIPAYQRGTLGMPPFPFGVLPRGGDQP